jgi:hypothetical protein
VGGVSESADDDSGDSSAPQGGYFERNGDVIVEGEIKQYDIYREGGMLKQVRPISCGYDNLNMLARRLDPGLQAGQHHLVIVDDGYPDWRRAHVAPCEG